MPSDYSENFEDTKKRDSEVSNAISLEISAFYGVQNKIIQRAADIVKKFREVEANPDPLSTRIQIPDTPPGVDIDTNITKAIESYNPFWFIGQVQSKGPWDYKRLDRKYEAFGNFNYGATALAFGYQEKWALQAAGLYQIYTSKAKSDYNKGSFIKVATDFSESFHGAPYGDDPKDQEMIKHGFRYYKEVYLYKYPPTETTTSTILKLSEKVYMSKYPGSELIAKSILSLLN
jgi:hypothetical protein